MSAHVDFSAGGVSKDRVGSVSPEHVKDLDDAYMVQQHISCGQQLKSSWCCSLRPLTSVSAAMTFTHRGLSLQGYRQKDYFIATQGPLPHTVEDFWRMVWEWKCHTIVMLTEVQEREQVCVPWLHLTNAINMSLHRRLPTNSSNIRFVAFSEMCMIL